MGLEYQLERVLVLSELHQGAIAVCSNIESLRDHLAELLPDVKIPSVHVIEKCVLAQADLFSSLNAEIKGRIFRAGWFYVV